MQEIKSTLVNRVKQVEEQLSAAQLEVRRLNKALNVVVKTHTTFMDLFRVLAGDDAVEEGLRTLKQARMGAIQQEHVDSQNVPDANLAGEHPG